MTIEIFAIIIVTLLYLVSVVGAFKHALSTLISEKEEKEGISYALAITSMWVFAVFWPLVMTGMFIEMAFSKGEEV